jgi:hypothetical protein
MLKWAPNDRGAMKLQKHGSRTVKGKEYFKWTLVIPPEEVKELGWEEGEELTPTREGKKLIIGPEREEEVKSRHRRAP